MNNLGIFGLAGLQLKKEGIASDNKQYASNFIERAITIRKYLDLQERNIKVAKSRYGK